uniref:Uncharacterized protein n=1 Tax=Amphimedon queenslandica TaxID=400682 RepID=A0A1X7V6Q7_AMPQE
MIREGPYQSFNHTCIMGAGVVWPSSALHKGHNIGSRAENYTTTAVPCMKSGPYGLYILGDPCATNLIGE